MTEKPKKSKTLWAYWQFLLAWVIGQFLSYWVAIVIGGVIILPIVFVLNLVGIDFNSFDAITRPIALIWVGAIFTYLITWAQQYIIRRFTGHHLKHWRMTSAVILAVLIPIVTLGGQWAWEALAAYRQSPLMETLFQVAPFILIWGMLGLSQAWLLRKRLKHVWLYALGMVVSGILFGVSQNPSSIFSHLLVHSVTGLTLIWIFYMSKGQDVQTSQDEAIARLSDSTSNEDIIYDDERESHQKRGALWEWLWRNLPLTFAR
ncbi:MAG: hypothetical protein AAF846_17445 [Chloroflexota bacterium]